MHIPDLKPKLNDDLRFLITCCQSNLSQEDTQFILEYLQTCPLDYDALVTLSYRHGALPLVHKTLKQLSSTHPLPSELCALLKRQNMTIAKQNMRMTAELIRIMKLLEENGIEALAFKGPTLSQMAYGNITLRQYVDLDILVDEENLHQVAVLLRNYHYTPSIPLSNTTNETFLALGHDYALFNEKNNITVELHWTLIRKNHSLYFNTFNLSGSSKSVTINQKQIQTFDVEFLLIYLCVHATKHLWARVEWITDIDRVLLNNHIKWDEVLDLAERLDHAETLYLGLSLSHTLFQTKMPSHVKNKLKQASTRKSTQLILNVLNSDFIVHQEGISAQMHKYTLFRLLKGKSTFKLFVLTDIIFDFSAYDYKSIGKLPKRLNFLYLILRPIHLIQKNIKRYWNH